MQDTNTNNHQPNVPKAELLERCNRRTQFYEVLTVLMPAVAVCLGVLKHDSPWMLFLAGLVFVGAAVPLYFAVVYASKAAVLAERRANTTRYALTNQRIRTLRIVSAPDDAVEALEKIRESLPPDDGLTEEALVKKLTAELGSERMKEVKDTILKYTKVDERDQALGSNSKPSNNNSESKTKAVVVASTI